MSKRQQQKQQKAGAFDVRNVIAELLGLYGVVLVVVGLVDDSADAMAKTGGVNANLWAGIGLIVVAVAFALWSRLRPTVVPTSTGDDSGPEA
ncbi:hypothetical protein DQ244_17580 [Blastococcus sp. TBT05-19]|uniref:hypothetical protein n=1 Tax=Blastococcus sp. TBT05-19 TaxID=2250581 RepID=UPI000DEB845A|nr:hypothetical protein [Blastococcus sp. TBT05-19]RBY87147.1 hypothetical protein DQ244_17580 [Blastococcus sp. TBT05-19]